jgi:hypothetical protein
MWLVWVVTAWLAPSVFALGFTFLAPYPSVFTPIAGALVGLGVSVGAVMALG